MSWRSLFGLPEPEERAVTESSVPWAEPFNVGSLSATVNPDAALSLGSVYAANRLLAQSISTLPLKAYRRGDETRVPLRTLPVLFNDLVSAGELVPWLHRCVTSLGLRGNAYGLVIRRDGFGFPTLIEWLDPATVTVDDRPGRGRPGWLVSGREVAAEGIVHIPWFTLPGQKLGLSPISAFAKTLGIGLNAQNYATSWFEAGGFPPGVMRNETKTISQTEAEEIKIRVRAAIRSRDPLVTGADWNYTAISVPPEEAQFIETMKMTTNQIASIYGIPPEMIGGESGSSMTYANVEQQQINFVMFTLRPWLVALESAFSALLPDRQYVKFNADALIRADLQTRWEVNKIRVEMGESNIDEIRTQEDKPPLPNGQGQQYGPATPPVPGVTPMRRVQ